MYTVPDDANLQFNIQYACSLKGNHADISGDLQLGASLTSDYTVLISVPLLEQVVTNHEPGYDSGGSERDVTINNPT